MTSTLSTATVPVLVIIPCLNEARHIADVLRHFQREAEEVALRIVVADGGSTDGTQAIVAAFAAGDDRIVLLDNSKRLQSAAVNLAVARFGYGKRYLLRVDAHAGYPEGYCAALLREAEAMDADSVVVPMLTEGSGLFQSAAALAQNSKLGNGGSAHRQSGGGRWVDHGHHALMSLAAFRAVGGYDESFSHNEDAELDQRLRSAGYRIWLSGETRIVYYPRSTPGALFRQYRHYGVGRARNVLKHRTIPKIRQMVPLAVAPAALLALLFPIAPIAAVPFLAWALVCLGYGAQLGIKLRTPAAFAAGPAAMVMHLGWSIGFWRTLLGRSLGVAR